MKKKVRWHTPGNGTCEYADIGEYRYYITQKYVGGYWYAERKPRGRHERIRCETFKELYKKLTDHELPTNPDGKPPKEKDYAWQLQMMLHGTGTMPYEKDGHHIAVDYWKKTFWEYLDYEQVTPEFETIPEVKTHIQKYYAEDDGQMTLEEFMR